MTTVAVDIGSGYVKAASSVSRANRRVIFPSLVGPMDRGARAGFGGDEITGEVQIDGKTWLVGDSARLRLRDLADTRSDDWAGSPGWWALLYAALSRLGITRGEVNLVTGVPQRSWTPALRDSLVSRLAGRHRAVVDGQVIDVEIACREKSMVLPQAFAGVSWLIDNDPSLARLVKAGTSGLVGGIDVGTYTSGYVVLDELQYRPDLSGGIHGAGMGQLAQHLIRLLDREFSYRPDLPKAMQYLLNPSKVFLGGEIQDIRPLVESAAGEIARSLLGVVSSAWADAAEGMEIVVFGGGAEYLYPGIVQRFPRARLAPSQGADAQFIPALGMLAFFAQRNDLADEVI